MTVECAICLERLVSERSLTCRHTFCSVCIAKWLQVNNKCPICCLQIGAQQNNTLSNCPPPESLPCIDHLYPEHRALQSKLSHLGSRIQTLRAASVKSCIPIGFLTELVDRLDENKELFGLFTSMVENGGNISEAVTLMETIGMGVIEIEAMLEGNSSREGSRGEDIQGEEEFVELYLDDEDDFPQLVSCGKQGKKRTGKAKQAPRKKSLK